MPHVEISISAECAILKEMCHFCANEKRAGSAHLPCSLFIGRPFSHHWTLESEVICALGSLSAYVCYPHFATVLFGRSAIRTHHCPFAKNGLYLPLANASALFCTDRVATTELGKSRANRTPISSFGDYRSTIELCSHIVEITDKR